MKKGVSLIEVLVTLGILMILFGIGTPFYTSYHTRHVLSRTTQEIAEEIRKVQIQSMAGLSGQDLGLHFEEDRYVFFEGGTYSDIAPENIEYLISEKVKISGIDFGGDPDVVFTKPNGDATTGHINITSADGSAMQIAVSDIGAVDTTIL